MQNFEKYKIIVVGSGLAAYSVIQKFENTDVPILIMKVDRLIEKPHYKKILLWQLNHWNLHWLRVLVHLKYGEE